MHGAKGSFDNYVDKMRLVGGPKMSICVHRVKKCTCRSIEVVEKVQNHAHVVIE